MTRQELLKSQAELSTTCKLCSVADRNTCGGCNVYRLRIENQKKLEPPQAHVIS